MRRKLVAGNWKMHGSLAANAQLLGELVSAGMGPGGAGCAVLVPFPYLAQAQSVLKGTGIEWGAQTLGEHPSGAYTGEVAGAMLAEFGCTYVTVGHSERRALFCEDSALVARKFVAACKAGLTPILCVGETLAEREAGSTEAVVREQLEAVFDMAGTALLANSIVAYEPVWAIGTGKTASPEQAQAVHAFIRGLVRERDSSVAAELPILYGGSVKAVNAESLFAMPDLDGGLVGGASLVAKEFLDIWRAAQRHAS
ncbi:MAG: triose-phosphate isomerase [Betaproteobacteria bacterium]